ncbi:hypothetical protein, partial [Burkholderia multivorans]|uniref:hypothetical protein n=1 Tax=Burkholderia multivorans TaxID=87883 RepID=UPI001ABB808C
MAVRIDDGQESNQEDSTGDANQNVRQSGAQLCDSRTSFHFLVRLFRSVVELEAPLGDASSTT